MVIVCDSHRAWRGHTHTRWRNRLGLAAVIAAAVLAYPSAAAAVQMDATDDPNVNGPLSTNGDLQACKRKREKTARGRLIARFEICSRYYLFDPNEEDSTKSDYGAYWVQVNVDATRQWCTRSVKIIVPLPATVHAKAPRPGSRVRGGNKKYTTKLEVDAQNHTSTPAEIKNSFTLRPKKLRSEVVSDGDKFRLSWTGSTARKLGYAAGIELSWASDATPPAVTPVVASSFAPRDKGC